MKKYLLGLLLALSALPALADAVAISPNGDQVHLTDAACAPKIVALIPDQLGWVKPLLRHANTSIGGKAYDACYFNKDGQVLMIYEDGDTGVIPRSEFRYLKEV